jgi:predicted nucleotide-binding protein (sugar kinase/HSP70/actin superfamily)
MDPTISTNLKAHPQVFSTLSAGVGRFSVRDKIFVLPEMARRANHLIAGVFRSFGVNTRVIETYKGMELGKEFTSGKECYPCQVTTGDILYFLKNEKESLGTDFHSEDYVIFMPTAEGPCRFGMYNKYQRIILDSFPEFKDVKIGTSNANEAYALDGMVEKEQETDLRMAGYFAIVVADVLDRLLWRVRPYEKKEGMTDHFIERSMHDLAGSFEAYGAKKDFDRILDRLEEIIEQGKSIIDPAISPKPLIGIVGEIYLRSHVQSNQDVIRLLEKYGGEVVNASIAEWFNYTTYDRVREAKRRLTLSLKQFHFSRTKAYLKMMIKHGLELWYQQKKQDQVYERVKKSMPLAGDHRIGHLDKILKEEDLYSFEVGTEACLSIPGIVEYVHEGYNGVVNVYPFTCMPSTITSAIVRPRMSRVKVPYLDTAYDGTFQPGREAAIRTFMYQAKQHYDHNGRIDLEEE